MTEKLSVVIPVYNEGENILKTLRSFYEKVRTPAEICLIYDRDDDTTIPVIRAHQPEFPGVFLKKNKYGRGVLNAIKSGLKAAGGDAVLVTMGDLSDDYSIVDQMFAQVKDGFDVVCGSRYIRGGKQIGGPLLKKTMTRIAGWSLHLLSGIPTHDISNSFKMYSKKLLAEIQVESSGGFEVGMEITVKAYLNGYKVTEIPSVWTDRAEGKSNFKLVQWLPKYLHWYFFLLKRKLFGMG
ncbi:glycosyltransferase family 2 protein [Candidatus Margulisiibacteriota bacterium]